MDEKGHIAIIVEGVSREPVYWNSLSNAFFSAKSKKIDFICLPADKNIYMLWKQLQADNFDTDIIEIVREECPQSCQNLKGLARKNFQEIYLFFDFDPQQRNLSENSATNFQTILKDMMKTFDNETDNGKLYISYPMAEALRDIVEHDCAAYYRCVISMSDLFEYKSITGHEENKFAGARYNHEIWMMILAIFLKRCRCLFSHKYGGVKEDEIVSWYKKEVTPFSILEEELSLWETHESVFVLSAFPPFVIDYFRPEHWNSLKENLRSVRVRNERNCDRKNK